ncbi:acetoacetyl-CoA reductase [Vitreoscilla stercoraria]|uniref:Acetoacetyl-CoA reductase n=1 Tax=Vitreoscilla stercoraria TaxID=61 RepID=A0ABY4E8B3_VITST|nr:acetoacetyl-CoA reductase [Vitreoscilla stercoraria]UOO91588.1 acetoacetyl-CoA reductase [Vitreoscilla stercoraria]
MTDKIALVTGGMGGIGQAICTQLGKAGYTVVSTFMRTGRDEAWLEQMQEQGIKAKAYQCDVCDFEQAQQLVANIKQDLGASVSILVNNAGITKDGTLRKMTYEQWQDVINTNLNSVFNLSKAVVDDMTNAGFGRIINISSINGQKGQFGQTNYSAAKAGMHGFSMALAQEVAKKGVTVNTISPGYIATEMVMAVDENIRNQIIAQIPVGRLGKPEEIASLVDYLASEAAGFITGSNIAINGGQHMK